VVWYDRSIKSGCVAAEVGKMGQLIRVSRLPWKIAYVAKAFLVFIDTRNMEIEPYKALVYNLKDQR
jgi:hypothetical protein